jgi:hypothetical protein
MHDGCDRVHNSSSRSHPSEEENAEKLPLHQPRTQDLSGYEVASALLCTCNFLLLVDVNKWRVMNIQMTSDDDS